jgi:exodeoxyribonuclease VII large subunit
LATLRRGYAVVQAADGSVVASTTQTEVGADLSIRLADGRVLATTSGVEPSPTEEDHA